MSARDIAALVGRVLLSGIFLISASAKFSNPGGTAQYMQAAHVPHVWLLLPVAMTLEAVGALLVLFGFGARVGAVLLVVFLIPVTFTMHNFWAYTGQQQAMQMGNFVKNFAVMGGLLMVLAFGAGAISFDRLLSRRRAAKEPPGAAAAEI